MGASMTTTGPLPAIRDSILGAQRMATLEHMGAFCSDVIPYGYVTADAVIDPCRGVLFIAVDQNVDPGDWVSVCGLIATVGWDNGSDGDPQDPGEPEFDPLSRVYTWRLEWVPQCIWCDGRGVSYGCPLCERTGLRYPGSKPPASSDPLSGAGGFCCPCPMAPMMRTW